MDLFADLQHFRVRTDYGKRFVKDKFIPAVN
jgi:hypothetical protein